MPGDSSIPYVVSRRFPIAKALSLPRSLSRLGQSQGGISPERRNELLREIAAYEAELRNKTPAELEALVADERSKEQRELVAKAEREEQDRFFNEPYARADFEHWSKMAHWTLDEAIALSFGKAPEVVNWDRVAALKNISRFAWGYGRRLELASRAKQWDQLFDPVLPGIFLAWAKRTDISVPPELEAAVTARGIQVADWKKLYEDANLHWKKLYDEASAQYDAHRRDWQRPLDEQMAVIEQLKARTSELEQSIQASAQAAETVGARERDSLFKMVIGMAIGAYRYNPKAARSEHPTEIAGDLAEAGVPLDPDTVRKWLKLAAQILPGPHE
jgi:hypothetical protein